MKRKILICLVVVALTAAATAVVLYVRSAREFRAAFGDGHARLVFKETSLGKTHPGCVPSTLTLHKESKSLAYFATRDNKAVVVWNGAEGPPYDYDDTDWTRHDTHGRHWDGFLFDGSKYVPAGWYETYEVERDNPLVFSPDGKHLAYVARRGGGTHVVFDGIESPEYSDVFYEITDSIVIKNIYGLPEHRVGFKFTGTKARAGQIKALTLGPTDIINTDADAVKTTYHQQRGASVNADGETGDVRDLVKTGVLDEPLTGPQEVSPSGGQPSSFYDEK